MILDPREALEPDSDERVLPVRLTKDQIKHHPIPESDPPLSHSTKRSGPDAMRSAGAGSMIGANPTELTMTSAPAYESFNIDPDPRLRSVSDVQDYKLRSGSEEIGKVTDFVLNPENWTVPYAVVELHDEHRQVLLPTEQISKIGFPDRILETEVMLEALRQGQPFEA